MDEELREYLLEYDQPVDYHVAPWQYRAYRFEAISDRIARGHIGAFIARTFLTKDGVPRYARMRCCLRSEPGGIIRRQIRLPVLPEHLRLQAIL